MLSSRDVARLALRALATLAQLQPATDGAGTVLQPLPRVLRVLGSGRCLSHLAQLLLTRDPAIVAQSAALLETTLAHNEEALARLYRTGERFVCLYDDVTLPTQTRDLAARANTTYGCMSFEWVDACN